MSKVIDSQGNIKVSGLGSVISQTITDGVVDKAPSEDAVFDALANKVPYTGATNDVDLGEFELKSGQIEFDQTPTGTAGVAVMRWNDTDGTVDLGLKGGNVTLQVGQEQVLRVVNKTATNVNLLEANYQAVRVTGAQGQRLKVDLALATNDLLSAETIGLVTETINNNQEGFITTSGLIRNINTTGSIQSETWADGDILYLSPTVAGQVTKVKPSAPNHLIIVGYVVSAQITQGSIFVKVDNGYELDELHNVAITSIADNDLLQYDSAISVWKNESLSTAGIQPTLVSATNIKTVNGNSLLGSGDLVISGGGGGITVGTTAVTSGTVGRVFFQGTGDVVQQDAVFVFNPTTKAFGVGTSSPSGIINGVSGVSSLLFSTGAGSVTPTLSVANTDASGKAVAFACGVGASVLAYSTNGAFLVMGETKANIAANSVGGGTVFARFETDGKLAIGANAAGAKLDVQAQGALSTDVAFRVRNSANTDNIISVKGNRNIFLLGETGNGRIELSATGGNATMKHRASAVLPSLFKIQSFGDGGSVGQIQFDAFDGLTPAFTIQRLISGLSDLTGSTLYSGFGTNAATFVMKNALNYGTYGVIPTGTAADHFAMYSADIAAGNAAPHFRTENGSIVKLYQNAAVTTPQGLADALTNLGLLAASTIVNSIPTHDGPTYDTNAIQTLTAAEYAAIGTPDPATLYFII